MRTSVRIAGGVLVGWMAAAGAAGSQPSPHTLPGFSYVSPAPGSALHLPWTNVIVRPGGRVDPASLVAGTTIQVTGSVSGAHEGRLKLSDDGRTLLFLPYAPYAAEESVTCVIAPGIATDESSDLPGATFGFRIAPAASAAVRRDAALEAALADFEVEARAGGAMAPGVAGVRGATGTQSAAGATDSIPPEDDDPLPPDFPAIQASGTGGAAPGAFFITDIAFDNGVRPSYLMILREDGAPIWYRKLVGRAFDFKMQPNRWLTYYDGNVGGYYALNARYALVDSFRCGNGYFTDIHELVLLPNGHALLMAYDLQPVDMSAVVPGGHPNAKVLGLIIQELDREKEVVFQWRSWDHFQITDATHRDLTATNIDYSHGNAIEADPDGHLFISSRHMDEITKISRETGEILWRLGGKNNQFTFVNDPSAFSHQHAVRLLPNGNITLYDNGNYHTPAHSRAVEYALDEVAMTATLVWEYRHAPDIYGAAMGYAQRLENGNTVVAWGSTNPTASEITVAGVKVAEINLPTSIYSYRAFKHEWPPILSARVTPRAARLNLSNGDPWVTVSIEPGEAFEADSIDVSTLKLEGVPADPATAALGDGDQDGTRDLTVSFPREALKPRLAQGLQALDLSGELRSGEQVAGAFEVQVAAPRPGRLRVMSPAGAPAVQLALGNPQLIGQPVTVSIYTVRGRLVARTVITSDAEGFIQWNGRGRGGEPVPSGIYFVRAERGGTEERAAVVWVK